MEEEDITRSDKLLRKTALVDLIPSFIDILDSLDQLIVIQNEDFEFIYLNKSALKWWDASFAQMYKLDYRKVMDEKYYEHAGKIVQKTKDNPDTIIVDPQEYEHNKFTNGYFLAKWSLIWISKTNTMVTFGTAKEGNGVVDSDK